MPRLLVPMDMDGVPCPAASGRFTMMGTQRRPTRCRLRCVREREQPLTSGLVSTARGCGRRRHRQPNSVRVCSPASRRLATLGPRYAGLTALTPAPRTLVQTGSCVTMPSHDPLYVVVGDLSRITHISAPVDTVDPACRGSVRDALIVKALLDVWSFPHRLERRGPVTRRIQRTNFQC